jgi:hypothetical protein
MFFTPIARAKKGRHKKVPPPQPTHIGAVKNPSHLAMHRCYEIKIGWNGINTVHLKGFTWMV